MRFDINIWDYMFVIDPTSIWGNTIISVTVGSSRDEKHQGKLNVL